MTPHPAPTSEHDRPDALDDLIHRLQATTTTPESMAAVVADADRALLAAAIRTRPEPWWFHINTSLTVFATTAAPGTGSAPHDHGLTAIIRCLDGIEGTRHYDLDDTDALVERGQSRLLEGETRRLPANAIHAVFNCWNQPNLVIHIYNGDFTTSTKHVWDPITRQRSPLTSGPRSLQQPKSTTTDPRRVIPLRAPTTTVGWHRALDRHASRGPYSWSVKIDVLSVPDCPNQAIAVSRIIEPLRAADVTDAEITARVVTNDADAHALSMHGSPTILIEGRDRFVETGTPPSMSCRLYHTAAGLEGAPSVTELIAAVTR